MVILEPTEEQVNKLFHALADATRRDIVRRCAVGESSLTHLAKTYPMSFTAVQKHVAVLERAGLVIKERRGREQLVHTDAEAVSRAKHVLAEIEATWRGRIERMADVLAEERETR